MNQAQAKAKLKIIRRVVKEAIINKLEQTKKPANGLALEETVELYLKIRNDE
jgi:hypothetical protein